MVFGGVNGVGSPMECLGGRSTWRRRRAREGVGGRAHVEKLVEALDIEKGLHRKLPSMIVGGKC